MASEKGDLPQDTDSLPPNYASSDVFTDSAPPAYRKTNTVRLQITRVVCFTILAAGLLAGIFILAHTWITTRDACDHGVAPNFPGQSASLIQASILPNLGNEGSLESEDSMIQELDNNDMDDSRQYEQESRLMDIPLPSEEDVSGESNEDRLEMVQEAMEEEAEGLQDVVEDVKDNVKLPIDLILGNPALAGKDVQCKVQKKMQNLGGGILSKTIIVTCDDEDEESKISNPIEALLGSRPASPVRPPMSLLAPILRMMAARASARLQKQLQPKPSMRRFPQPMMQPVAISMNGPMPQQFPGPFPGSFEASGPFSSPMNQMPMHRGMHHGRPMPAIFAGRLPMPGNSIIQPNMGHMPFPPQESSHHTHHHHHSHDEPHMHPRGNENMPFRPFMNPQFNDRENVPFRGEDSMPFRGEDNMPFRGEDNMPFRGEDNMPFRGEDNMPFRGEDNMPFRGNENTHFEENINEAPRREEQEMPFPTEEFNNEETPEIQIIRGPEPLFRPLPPQGFNPEMISEIQNRPPIKIVHGFPPQIPDAIKQLVSHIMKSSNKNEDQENMPVIAIKAMHEGRMMQPNQGPLKSKMLMPFPFRALKLQSRAGRQLEHPEEQSVSFSRIPFPLPRGALTSGLKPLIVPEAAGRALDSPVTIPSLPDLPSMRFFPGRLLRLPIPLPEGRAITHMEIKQNPNSLQINEEESQPSGDEQNSQFEPEVPVDNEGPDFGPPRLHTVITGPPPPMQENTPEEESPLPPFLQRFPPPPPPHFAREGRSGIIREINPDAELVTPTAVTEGEHHVISVN